MPPNATFSGNGGAAINCDTTSVLYGDTTGIAPITCGAQGGEPPGGPPGGPHGLTQRVERVQEHLLRAAGTPRALIP